MRALLVALALVAVQTPANADTLLQYWQKRLWPSHYAPRPAPQPIAPPPVRHDPAPAPKHRKKGK